MKIEMNGDTSPRVAIEVSKDILELLYQALDSHSYWQLTPEQYRRDGYSLITEAELHDVAKMSEEDLDARAEVEALEHLQVQLHAAKES